MSWRDATLKDRCIECKQPIHGQTYVGEMTPATWCESCAETSLGKSIDAQDVPKHIAVETRLQGMRELVMKFAPKVAKTWGERE